MIILNTKSDKNANGDIIAVHLERTLADKLISKFTIQPGVELIVKSYSSRALKHKDRIVKVVKFIHDEHYGLRVDVKFLDNGRRGKIDIADLDTF